MSVIVIKVAVGTGETGVPACTIPQIMEESVVKPTVYVNKLCLLQLRLVHKVISSTVIPNYLIGAK